MERPLPDVGESMLKSFDMVRSGQCVLIALMLGLMLFAVFGCASHSSRYATAHADLQRCNSFPCGGEIIYPTMVVSFQIDRTADDVFILSGTATPRVGQPGQKIDVAVLGVELARDITITDSFEVGLRGNVIGPPLTFRHEFTPSGGFDGVSFTADIHLAE